MPTKQLRLAPVVTALALAACGGGGNGAGVAPPGSSPVAKTSLALTVVVPAPRLAAGRARTTYVSPATQSLSVLIKAGATTVLQEAVGLTVASNPANCTAAGGATTCTVLLGLAAGSYTGTFATYAGPVVSGAATGAVLSSGQSLPMVAVAGQTNTIAITLDGVPASIVISPAAGSTITGTQTGAGFVVRYAAEPLTVEALDAASNIIMGAGRTNIHRRHDGQSLQRDATASRYAEPSAARSDHRRHEHPHGNGRTSRRRLLMYE